MADQRAGDPRPDFLQCDTSQEQCVRLSSSKATGRPLTQPNSTGNPLRSTPNCETALIAGIHCQRSTCLKALRLIAAKRRPEMRRTKLVSAAKYWPALGRENASGK